MAKYIDFLYADLATGEEFLVELKADGKTIKELRGEANIIAEENFEAPTFKGIVSEEQAEMMGIDTY